jgi:hypothetical protein
MNGKTVLSFKISIASDLRLMSGGCTCNQIRAALKGRGIICNRKAVKAPAIRDLRNSP